MARGMSKWRQCPRQLSNAQPSGKGSCLGRSKENTLQRAGGKLSTTFLPGGKSPEGPCNLPESGNKRIPVSGNKESAGAGV